MVFNMRIGAFQASRTRAGERQQKPIVCQKNVKHPLSPVSRGLPPAPQALLNSSIFHTTAKQPCKQNKPQHASQHVIFSTTWCITYKGPFPSLFFIYLRCSKYLKQRAILVQALQTFAELIFLLQHT
jgi:hypothetical protein